MDTNARESIETEMDLKLRFEIAQHLQEQWKMYWDLSRTYASLAAGAMSVVIAVLGLIAPSAATNPILLLIIPILGVVITGLQMTWMLTVNYYQQYADLLEVKINVLFEDFMPQTYAQRDIWGHVSKSFSVGFLTTYLPIFVIIWLFLPIGSWWYYFELVSSGASSALGIVKIAESVVNMIFAVSIIVMVATGYFSFLRPKLRLDAEIKSRIKNLPRLKYTKMAEKIE